VYYGESGIDLYAQDRRSMAWVTLDRPSLDVMDTFPSFDALLTDFVTPSQNTVLDRRKNSVLQMDRARFFGERAASLKTGRVILILRPTGIDAPKRGKINYIRFTRNGLRRLSRALRPRYVSQIDDRRGLVGLEMR
jgi:hypothetical protein